MVRAKLQFIGPAVMFAAVASAEGAAYALSQSPSSETLWYINLRLFGLFQTSHYLIGAYTELPYFQLLFIAIPIIMLASYGARFKRALPLACASNLSCGYAVFLLYAWLAYQHLPAAASLVPFLVVTHISLGPDLIVCGVLVAATLLSLCASHLGYIRSLRRTLDDR